MSKENLEQFISKVADSEELQAKIGEEIDAEALIALGAECGCEFTADALRGLISLQALSDISFYKPPYTFNVLFETTMGGGGFCKCGCADSGLLRTVLY